MVCYLLHTVEIPKASPYDDADIKDLVGEFPRLFCAHCTPPRELSAGEGVRCLECDAPCWKPADKICG